MKIALIAQYYLLDKTTAINGTQVQLYNLALAFKNRGLDVHYIAMSGRVHESTETSDGIHLHWFPENQAVFSWINEIRAYEKVLDKIQPDVLYQRGRSHFTYVAAHWSQKNGKAFIWGSNGEDSCEFWKLTKRVRKSERPLWKKTLLYPYQAIQDMLIHKGLRGATHIVNQTEYQRARLLKNYMRHGIVLPSYFLPPSDVQPSQKEKVVLWLAALNPNKQPEKFIELARYCQDCPDWKFVLGGGTSDKNYFRSLNREVEKLSNLEMIGQVPFLETADHYERSMVFVNTSVIEGLPNAYIQAWLVRTPTLALNQDPNGWIEEHDLGVCAHGNLDQFLKEGKALLLDDKRRAQMGENSVRFAEKTFAADATIDAYLKLFESIV